MRSLILILAMLAGFPSFAECKSDLLSKDGFPWPWSKQCPFPWASIEGRWSVVSPPKLNVKKYFEFRVLSQSEFGENYLIVEQYNSKHEIVARGIGYSRGDSLGVIAAIRYVDGRLDDGFWLHVSAFVEESISSPMNVCESAEIKTAVKITAFGKEQDDTAPSVIKKMQSDLLD